MPMSRFWSVFGTVVGFLFLLGWLQGLADLVFSLFGLLDLAAPQAMTWIRLAGGGLVPLWGAITFIDWRWGWKPDNAGLRTHFAAVFWLIPGVVAGALAAGLAYFVEGGVHGATTAALPALTTAGVVRALLLAVQIFAAEMVFRGVVISRFQSDISGRDLLLLALGTPLVWALVQQLFGRSGFIPAVPSPGIYGPGTIALSLFLSLLFLRTDSVWLVSGVRAGLVITTILAGLGIGSAGGPGNPGGETGLLLVFGLGSAILLLLELTRMNRVRRPGPRGGRPQRVVYGKTVRGPWGPH